MDRVARRAPTAGAGSTARTYRLPPTRSHTHVRVAVTTAPRSSGPAGRRAASVTGAVISAGNATPVSSSDAVHSRPAIPTSLAAADRPTSVGIAVQLPPAAGTDVAAAGQVLGGGVRGGQRAHRGALGDDPVDHAHDPVDHLAAVVELQVRRRVAGVRGERPDRRPHRREPALQLQGEQQVGQLGLPVRLPAPVRPALPVEVGQVDPTRPMRPGRHRDHPVGDLRQQQVGQGERAEVVGPELALEAVGGPGERWRHHAGVVDQHVDRLGRSRGEGLDRVQPGQVELAYADLTTDVGGGPLALADVADGQGDPGPGPGEHPGGLEADPAVASGDHHVPPGLVGDVVGGPVRSGHAAQLSRALQPPLLSVRTWLSQAQPGSDRVGVGGEVRAAEPSRGRAPVAGRWRWRGPGCPAAPGSGLSSRSGSGTVAALDAPGGGGSARAARGPASPACATRWKVWMTAAAQARRRWTARRWSVVTADPARSTGPRIRAAATASCTARLIPTPPTGDIAWAASPISSSPSAYQRRSRSSRTLSSLTSSKEARASARSPSQGTSSGQPRPERGDPRRPAAARPGPCR